METAAQTKHFEGRPTVYYDGSCPLCSVEIRHYQSRDGAENIDFVDVSSEQNELGEGLTCETAMKRFHVRMPDGSLKSGAAGFAAIWSLLPGWAWLARVAQVPGVLPVLELAYRLFLPIRPLLSRVARLFGARPLSGDGR